MDVRDFFIQGDLMFRVSRAMIKNGIWSSATTVVEKVIRGRLRPSSPAIAQKDKDMTPSDTAETGVSPKK